MDKIKKMADPDKVLEILEVVENIQPATASGYLLAALSMYLSNYGATPEKLADIARKNIFNLITAIREE